MGVLSFDRLKLLTIDAFQANGLVTHAFCTRLGGVSQGPYRSLNFDPTVGDSRENVNQNKEILGAAMKIDPERIFIANQVHGDQVLVLEGDPRERSFVYHHLDYDAIITKERGIAIGVLTADCLPILLLDPNKEVIGVIHSGWRGTCLNICGNVIYKLKKEFEINPKDILVGVGPCIGPCCYEVDIKVIRSIKNSSTQWKDFIKPLKTNRYSLNLVGLNVQQLIDAGIEKENVHYANVCTACHSKLFFSHRAGEGKTGRQLSFIQLNER